MGNLISFKSKGGFNSNGNRIKEVATPIESDDAATKEYVDNQNTIDTLYIKVIDAETNNIQSSINKTFKNGIYIISLETASDDINITFRFNKSFLNTSLPDVKYGYNLTDDIKDVIFTSIFTEDERNNIDFSIESQILTNGNLTILNLDYVETFEFKFHLTGFTGGYFYFKNGSDIYKIEIIKLNVPIINSAAITNDYPINQNELADNENINVSITADSNISEIQIIGDYYASNSIVKNSTNNIENISTIVNNGPINTNTAINGYFKVRIKDENDTWSEWYDSELKGNNIDKIDFMNINNSVPIFNAQSFNYSNAPYTALNTDNNSIITYNLNYLGSTGDVNAIAINNSNLNIVKNSDTQFTVTATTNVYKYNIPTITITAIRTQNGKSAVYSPKINIASVDMIIGSMSINTFRSGPTGYTSKFNIIGNNQELNNKNISLTSPPNGMTLESEGIISNTNLNNLEIKITDDSIKGTYSDILQVQLIGLSGRTVTKTFDIINSGFVSRTLTGQDLQNAIVIPTIINIENLIVSVGDNNNLNSCTYFSTTSTTPGFQGDSADQINEFYVFNDNGTWKIIFDNNIFALAGPGGWLTNARIILEETI